MHTCVLSPCCELHAMRKTALGGRCTLPHFTGEETKCYMNCPRPHTQEICQTGSDPEVVLRILSYPEKHALLILSVFFVCFLGNQCHEISTYFSCVTQHWAYTRHSVSIHLIDLTLSEVFQSPNLGYSINWLGGPGQIIYTSRIFITSLIH